MANFCKVKMSGCESVLKHNSRELPSYSNEDVDITRSDLNIDLTPIHEGFEPEKYNSINERSMDYLSELLEKNYVYGNRDDITILTDHVVTLPRSVVDYCSILEEGKTLEDYPDLKEKTLNFFENVEAFYEERYGKDNIVQAIVHFDEGHTVEQFTTEPEYKLDDNLNYVLDENGERILINEPEVEKKFIGGGPHIHITIAPIMREGDTYTYREGFKEGHYEGKGEDRHFVPEQLGIEVENEVKIKEGFEGKFDCNHLFNRWELRDLHPSLQDYLHERNIEGWQDVYTGITKRQGGNRTVSELKSGLTPEERYGNIREVRYG